MSEELIGLTKESKSLPGYLASPYQRKKILATLRSVARRPSKALELPKRYGEMVRRGAKSGFKEKGVLAKGMHGLAVADPAITLYNIAQRPEEFKGRVGRSLGESAGLATSIMAGSKLPVLGQLIAGTVGRRAGGVVGGKIDPKIRREAYL